MSSINNGFDIDKEFKKADVAADMERYDLVITLMRDVLQVQPNSAYAFRKLAHAHFWRDEFAAGLDAIENSLRLNSEDDYAHALYGQLLYSVDRNDEAKGEFEIALAMNPMRAITHYWYTRLLRDYKKDYEKALIHAAKALEIMPDNADYHLLMGVTVERAGDLEESGKYYKAALKLEPQNPYALNNYGWYLLECRQEINEAIELFRQSLSLKPDYQTALTNLRYAENRLKEMENAKQQDSQASENELEIEKMAQVPLTKTGTSTQEAFGETDLPVSNQATLLDVLRPFGKILNAVMKNLRELA